MTMHFKTTASEITDAFYFRAWLRTEKCPWEASQCQHYRHSVGSPLSGNWTHRGVINTSISLFNIELPFSVVFRGTKCTTSQLRPAASPCQTGSPSLWTTTGCRPSLTLRGTPSTPSEWRRTRPSDRAHHRLQFRSRHRRECRVSRQT